jgi:hypothetical protein
MSVPPESYVPSSHGGRSGQLDRCLSDLLSQAPELEAAAVVSFDGLAMASALPVGMDEDRVAAMSAALLSLGEKAAQGLGRGDLSQVYIEGEYGTVFLVSALDEAVLVAVAAKAGKTGLMLYEVRRSAAEVGRILQQDGAFFSGHTAEHAAPASTVEAGYDNEPQPSYDEPQPSHQEEEPQPSYQQADEAPAEAEAPSQDDQSGDEPQQPVEHDDHHDYQAAAENYQPEPSEPESYEAAAAEPQPESEPEPEPEPSRPFEDWSAPQQSAMVMAGEPSDETHEHYFSDQAPQQAPTDETENDREPEAELATTPPAPTGVWSPYSPQQQPASSS